LKLAAAYVALGSNLGDPVATVSAGIEELAMLPSTLLAGASSLYRTAPVGFEAQPEFVNAVAHVQTALAPRDLLDALLAIERSYGRVREQPNGPRTLDLDILLYGDLSIDEPGLTIPHPRMHERAFVMVPLAEIAPDVIIGGHGTAVEIACAIGTAGITRIDPNAP
jgi:2-amino-4-hydroxy-6-hydroxymethyldihydropteridine diphosphokinase